MKKTIRNYAILFFVIMIILFTMDHISANRLEREIARNTTCVSYEGR